MSDLVSGLGRFGNQAPVDQAMQRAFTTVDAGEMLEIVFRKMQECQCSSVPVIQQGRLVGIITPENIGEFVMIQNVIRSAGPGPGDSANARPQAWERREGYSA